MEEKLPPEEENPIPEFVDGHTYASMKSHTLLDLTGLRNYCIRRSYKKLRRKGENKFDCLDRLSAHYGLSISTILNIVSKTRVYTHKEQRII
ncbi:MAG: hypothetical protein HF308_18250 [Ignavibacteria bacterium]|jgi:hypothetical protein|nr:hypothetical protein [Ignavibacteria bacterium]MCU7522288.1 hypothetical protein [Ignavibacteria bacterium]MCU7526424.1 hypothetical protein [Ignavibacteria bacterium]